MNMPTPRFTGIFIPVEILEHPDLTMLEQLLLSWIDALYSKEHGGCFAKNDYFAERLKVKENTIVKALTSLRQKNLIEDVSFDGRRRVIRAKIGEHVEKTQSKSGLDLNPKQDGIKIPGSMGFKSYAGCDLNPRQGGILIPGRMGFKSSPSYIESKEEIKEYIPPSLPPNSDDLPMRANSAADAAGECGSFLCTSKKKKAKSDYSEQVQEVAARMLEILADACPIYRPPSDMTKFLSHVETLIEKDEQDPEIVLRAFAWAVSDTEKRGDFSGWQGIVATNNKGSKQTTPAEIFRKYFTKIHAQMNSRPKRKFAASSDNDEAYRILASME